MSSNLGRELQVLLRQRENELVLAQAEVEERNGLLAKASSAITSLQNEFMALRKEHEMLRAESSKVRMSWSKSHAKSHAFYLTLNLSH